MLNIAYTIEDTSFLFRGAPDDTLKDVFNWLGAGGNAFEYYTLAYTLDVLRRNGKATYYYNITLVNHNPRFCSIDDLALLVESRLHATTPCRITKLTINRFLNV